METFVSLSLSKQSTYKNMFHQAYWVWTGKLATKLMQYFPPLENNLRIEANE